MWETMRVLSFESFHHEKWTLLLATGSLFLAFCVGLGGWFCAQMSSMQVTWRNGLLEFLLLSKNLMCTFCNSGSILFSENLLLLSHDQSTVFKAFFLKAFWKMVNMAPGIFGTTVDVMILLSFCWTIWPIINHKLTNKYLPIKHFLIFLVILWWQVEVYNSSLNSRGN